MEHSQEAEPQFCQEIIEVKFVVAFLSTGLGGHTS
jgi:hypothetical protein